MTNFIIFGGVTFWLLVALTTVFIITGLELKEKFWFSAVLCGVLFAGLFRYISAIELTTLCTFGLTYIVIGILWSFIQWHFYLKECLVRAKQKLRLYDSESDPAQHKAVISAWVFYWPWSLVWRGSRQLFLTILDLFSGVYERMSSKIKLEFEGLQKTDTSLK